MSDDPRSEKPLILVTDDSAFARRHTRRLLEELGYRVIEAGSGSEALRQHRTHRPKAILLDMLMAGGMDGDQVLTEIRAVDPDVAVVIVTADVQTITSDMMRAKGATKFLTKPLTAGVLATALNEIFHLPAAPATPDREDQLAEVIQLGYGRAAAALSAMTHQRVKLQAPTIILCPVEELASHLAPAFQGEAACVNQIFSGPIGGSAMFLLDLESARQLAALLEPATKSAVFDQAPREIIVETGNVLLNACLGAFGNLLKVQVQFAVPRLHIDTVPGLLRSTAAVGMGPPTQAVIVRTQFCITAENISGYLLILMGLSYFNQVAAQLTGWGRASSRPKPD
jgi:chemotaxis protein CheC